MKRMLDTVFSLIILLMLCPIIILIMIMVYVQLGRPIIFKQNRPGKDAQAFAMYKFRTMTNCCDEHEKLLQDCDRLTVFGKFLRKTSLDELPEIWNVIKGDMSLVGPRPLLIQYLDRYTSEQARRHEVRPGITGWAQINGRNNISWDEKFKLDVWYVDNRSLWLDIRIMLMSIIKVLKGEDINQQGQATMKEFRG